MMSTAVRYYSRSGNTKLVAEAIAKALGVSAVSVDRPEAALNEKADVLFIGGLRSARRWFSPPPGSPGTVLISSARHWKKRKFLLPGKRSM